MCAQIYDMVCKSVYRHLHQSVILVPNVLDYTKMYVFFKENYPCTLLLCESGKQNWLITYL